MFVFGLMAIIDVCRVALRQIQPVIVTVMTQTAHVDEWSKKTTDHYLFRMLFIQGILLTLFSLPQAIHILIQILLELNKVFIT
jgi:hypothetical protein